MSNTISKLISHGSVYFVGNILRNAVSFVMLPIYTRVLTPSDYGTIELLSMVIDFAGIIFGLRIGEAIFRFYLMAESEPERNQIISSSLILTTLLNCFGFLVLYAVSGFLSKAIFGGLEHQNLLILFSLSLLFQPIIEIPMSYIRAQQRPWLFISFSTFKLGLQLSLNIYLVVLQGLGVKGVILSAVITGCVMSLLLGGYCISRTGLFFSLSRAKTLVVFSYPMILASLFSFYITFGDRYFLNLYGTLADVGIYALGYKFGFLLDFIGTGPFSAVWDSERYNILKKPDAKSIFQNVFVLFTVFTLMVVIGISLFTKNILMIMSSSEFWGAARIAPIILLAYFIQGLMGYCSLGILVHKKTFIITKSTMLSAVLITVLYLVLIPRFGAFGAAWATALASLARFSYVYYHSKKLYDMELPWKRVSYLFPVSILAVVISLFGPDQIAWSIALNIAIFIFFIYTLTCLPVLQDNYKILLRNLFVRPLHFPRELRDLLKKI